MNEFDIKSRERLVRVEVGITNLTSIVKKQTEALDKHLEEGKTVIADIESLKMTQRIAKWASKTTLGAAILAVITYLVL